MPNNFGDLGEKVIEQGMGFVKQQTSAIKKSAAQQVGVSSSSDSSVPNIDQAQIPGQDDDQAAKDPASDQAAQQQNAQTQAAAQQQAASDQQKIAAAQAELRKLHQQSYYQPLVAYEHRQEKSVADRLAEEKQKEDEKKMVDLQKKKEKDAPIAVQRAQSHEIQKGASG